MSKALNVETFDFLAFIFFENTVLHVFQKFFKKATNQQQNTKKEHGLDNFK